MNRHHGQALLYLLRCAIIINREKFLTARTSLLSLHRLRDEHGVVHEMKDGCPCVPGQARSCPPMPACLPATCRRHFARLLRMRVIYFIILYEPVFYSHLVSFSC